MILIASSISGSTYKHLLKPLLFHQKPDDVHHRLMRYGGRLQRIGIVPAFIQSTLSHDHPMLEQTIHGITYRNPVGLSAGFDKNIELATILKAVGFGFVEGGSITAHAYKGNPRPWFHRLPNSKSLVVNAGLPNEGVDVIVERIRRYPIGTFSNFPLNISVAKTNSPETCDDSEAIRDYIVSLEKCETAGVASVYTLNISCPNTFGGEPFTTPARLDSLLSAVDELQIKKPMYIKMPSDKSVDAFRKLIEVAAKHRVQGLTIANLQKNRAASNLADSLDDTIKGNLSGKPTWDTSNRLIADTYRHFGDRFTIVGVGGVFSAADAYTKIRLGSTLVELITGMIFEGPQLIGQINHGLVKLLERDGFSSISDAVGVDAKV